MNSGETDPVRLVEDAATGDRFLVYQTAAGPRLDIRFHGETLWMSQAQIAELFGVDRSVVSRHLSNIYDDGEVDADATSAKIAQVRVEGDRTITRQIDHYNLDAVISVGYRVSSVQATLFRKWATSVLVRYARAGFVVDSVRLKNPENADRVAQLREIIRDIRSDEANVYRELKAICAMCRDYDPGSEAARTFYRRMQARLVYAVTAQTPSELIASRADHAADNMGLTNWPLEIIRKSDVSTSKNYLADGELRELNRLTTILLDVFEDQLAIGRIVVMDEAAALLDRQLAGLGRAILRGGGSVSAQDARRRAEAQYDKFAEARKLERAREADEHIVELARQAKELPKPRRS